MPYTVAEAAKTIGKSKAAVFRAIRKGKLSAARAEPNGAFLIDPAELHRAFQPAPAVSPDTLRDTANGTSRGADIEGRLADAHETIRDLRNRLDQTDADRRQALDRLAAAQERIAALLTDRRATISWGGDRKSPIGGSNGAELHRATPPRPVWRRLLRALGHVR